MSAINKLIGALSGTRFAGSGAAMLGALAAFAGLIPASSAWAQTTAAAGVKISQVFTAGNQPGSTCASDFVELHNSGTSPENIGGWQLCYSTSTTGSISIPDALNRRVNFSAGTEIPAGGYLLVQLVPSTSVNLAIKPDAVAQDTIDLQDSGNFVLLNQPLQAGTASISPTDPRIKDRVSWGQGVFPETTAVGTPGTKALCRKNQGARDTNNNAADFFLADPSPRSVLIRTAYRYDDVVGAAGWTTVANPADSTAVDFSAVSGMWSLTAHSAATISATRAFDVPAGVGSDVSIGFKPNFMDNAPDGAAARLEFLSANNTVMLCLEARPSNGDIAYQLLECTGSPRANFQSDVRMVKFVVAVREGQYSVCWECQGGVTGAWNETGAGAGTAISKIRVVNANAGVDSRVSFDDVRVEDAVLTRIRGFQNPNGYDVDCPIDPAEGYICAHFNVTSGAESPRGDIHIPSGTLVRGVRVKLANLKDTQSPQNLRIVLKRWAVGADTETAAAIATASLVPAITTYNRKFNGDYRFADTAVANLATAAGLAATQQASTILQSIYFPLSDQSGVKDPLDALIGSAGYASGHWGVEVTDGSNPNATINGVDLELVLVQDFDGDGLPDPTDPCPLVPGGKITYYLDADFDNYTAMSAPGSTVPATAQFCPGEQPNTYDPSPSSLLDCNDSSNAVYPTAPELCSTVGTDNNCNILTNPDLNEVDAQASDKVDFYRDGDRDTWTTEQTSKFCPGTSNTGWLAQAHGTDCDDANAAAYPGAPELCATVGTDNNCNGTPENQGLDEVDAGAEDKVDFYRDADRDTWTTEQTSKFCPGTSNTGWLAQAHGTDCDDANAAAYPGAPELCATVGTDNNCNGTPENQGLDEVDAGAEDKVDFYRDADRDTWTTEQTSKFCPGTSNTGWLAQAHGTDCDDANAAAYPGAPELCATVGTDNNCNGTPENQGLDEVDAGAEDKVDFYRDADRDTWTTEQTSKFCPGTSNTGWLAQAHGTDCDDANAAAYPGAPELCATVGTDNNCNGTPENQGLDEVDAGAEDKVDFYRDADRDTWTTEQTSKFCPGTSNTGWLAQAHGTDCDDANAAAYPGAPELCATVGTDNNCNGTPENQGLDEVDAGAEDKVDFYRDADRDTWTTEQTSKFCPGTSNTGWLAQAHGTDCDDANAAAYPGAPELCATVGTDNNCNGTPENQGLDEVDAGAEDKVDFYRDADRDTWTTEQTSKFCPGTSNTGWLAQAHGTDCDDANAAAYPGAPELCATVGTDNNCNGTPENQGLDEVDAGAEDKVDFYRDADRDTWTTEQTSKFCPGTSNTGWLAQAHGTDCDDANAAAYPGAPELCATVGTDNNCNGTPENQGLDEVDAGAEDKVDFYRDADRDTWTTEQTSKFCPGTSNTGWLAQAHGTDCDDANAAAYPGAPELCATVGTDNNCNGTPENQGLDEVDAGAEDKVDFYRDADRDTWTTEQTSKFCPGTSNTGWLAQAHGTDCDDANAAAYPGAPELCATVGTDNNCNILTNPDLNEVDADASDKVTFFVDQDGDHYAPEDPANPGYPMSGRFCVRPDGYVSETDLQIGFDCADLKAAVHPGAIEDCTNMGIDNNCANGVDDEPAVSDVEVPVQVESTREALLAEIASHDATSCFAFTGVIDIDTTWDDAGIADPAGDLALLASFIKESAPISAQVNVDSSQMTEDDGEWDAFLGELSALVVDSTLALDRRNPANPRVVSAGEVLEVGVSIHNMACPAVGVFVTLNFDPQVLELAIDPQNEGALAAIVPSREFDRALFAATGIRSMSENGVSKDVGFVKFSVGVCEDGSSESGFTTAPAASVRFRVKQDAQLCGLPELVWAQSEGGDSQFDSRISSRGANPGDPVVPIPHAVVNKTAYASVNALRFNDLPAESAVTVPADAGFRAAYFADPGVSAENRCGDSFPVDLMIRFEDGSTRNSWPEGGMFPIGTTEVTWKATGDALPIEATRSYTVEDYQLAKVQVKLVGGSMDPYRSFCQELRVKVSPMSTGGNATVTTLVEAGVDPCPDQIDPLQPFVHFEQSSVTLPEHALLADEAIMKIAPAGAYTCMWVKDPKHTLGKRKSLIALPAVDSSGQLLRPAGERYYVAASATVPESFDLLGGDATDDNLIDVLDFGAWVTDRSRPGNWQRNPWDRSNFNRDQCVGNADFCFIAAGSQFLKTGDGECGASNLAGDDTPMPRQRVSVKELRRLGLGEMAEADMNGDGWIDQTDMAIVIQGGSQGTRAPQAGSERGLNTRW